MLESQQEPQRELIRNQVDSTNSNRKDFNDKDFIQTSPGFNYEDRYEDKEKNQYDYKNRVFFQKFIRYFRKTGLA